MGFVGLNFGIRRDYIYRDKMGFGKPYFIYQMKIKERPYHLEYLKKHLLIKKEKVVHIRDSTRQKLRINILITFIIIKH